MTADLGVLWYRLIPSRAGSFQDPATGLRLRTSKRPFATTPQAAGLALSVLIEDHPRATVAQIKMKVHYDPELAAILDDYVTRGHGHFVAADLFAHA